MTKRMRNGIVVILLLCVFCKTKAKTSNLIKTEKEVKKSNERKLTKRGNFGDHNEYGPATHISSAVLQLEHSPEIEFDDHSDILHESLDVSAHKEPQIWNSIAFGWQPVHKVIDSADEGYEHYTGLEENTFSHGLTNEYLPRSGLHTQIISSSGLDISELSDKIDLNNVVDLKEKHYIKSYG